MSKEIATDGVGERWARLRFAVVGALLVCPPRRGELRTALEALAARPWQHPSTGEAVRFGYSTLERWYYQARRAPNPVEALARRLRVDAGESRAMSEALLAELEQQWRQHPSWTYKLHADNLAALAKQKPELGEAPSYTTVRRRMRERGWSRRKRLGHNATEAQRRAVERLEQREVRSFEARWVHALWHADFHKGSRRVVDEHGAWHDVLCLAILDDRSRLCCHAQWYPEETAHALIHGLTQAFAKRGLPRGLMEDNGRAMCAAETREGLAGLGVHHPQILDYSPYQNGKEEHFWTRLEGRLLSMLEGVERLTLAFLNEATQAWVELEYNREIHGETGEAPLDRMLAGPNVARACPDAETLRWVFTRKARRTQRRSDGTVSIDGVRFELPSRLRTLRQVWVRWAFWDLSAALVVDARDHRKVLAEIHPLDKARNADARRRALEPVEPAPSAPASRDPVAPLLRHLMAEYAATGQPPAYIPFNDTPDTEDDDDA
jgi:hypothetical protein